MRPLLDRAAKFLRRWDGRLTQELVLHPAQFGLGKVPARLKPDDVTSMICGFCSTGCSLNVHLKNGQAVNLTPNKDYPVNLGMACPKGWEALTPLSARDRATTPLLRGSQGNLEPIDWDTALQIFTLRFKAIMEQHGPESVAFISTGQIVCEEMALLGALAKLVLRLRCSSVHLPRLRRIGCHCSGWLQSLHRPSHPLATNLPEPS